MTLKQLFLSAAGITALLTPGFAHAQEAADATLDDSGSSSDPNQPSSGIAQIVVVAQKRAQNLQDVPVAVTAMTSEALDTAGVKGITDLVAVVPTLSLQNTNGYLTGSIRGIGSNSVGPGYENQVALYIDGVYMGSPAAGLLNFNNIKQIDVLKGPQGTLFGRNATAGVIQVTTKDPTYDFSGSIKAGLANYVDVSGDLYVSGGLSDNVAADIAIHARTQGDGYGVNRFNGRDMDAVTHDIGVRSKVLFEPSDRTRITLIGDFSDVKDNIQQSAAPGYISPYLGGPAPDYGWGADFDGPGGHDFWGAGGSLKIEQDIGTLKFVSQTAYRKSRAQFDFDFDRTSMKIVDIYARQVDRQFSQEIQLQSPDSARFQWVVGGFFFDARSGWQDFLLQRHGATNVTVSDYQTTTSYAVFGQATYEIFDGTNLTFGARYTDERKSEKNASVTVTLDATGDVLAFVPLPDRVAKASEPTFRVILDHRFSPDLMAYVSFNTGFKSGGFNSGNPGSTPYEPEKIRTYEAGFKSDLLDGNLRFNAAGFYNDYTNIQLTQLLGTSIGVVNGPSAKVYGMEADAVAQITDGLQLSAGVMWLDPHFDFFGPTAPGVGGCDFTPAGGGIPATPNSDCSNNQIPLAAKFTGNLAIDYTYNLPSGGTLHFNGNMYHSDKYYFDVGNQYPQKSYELFGASLAWTNAADNLTVRLYGKNLGNTRVVSYQGITTSNGGIANIWAPPRTYGATVEFKF